MARWMQASLFLVGLLAIVVDGDKSVDQVERASPTKVCCASVLAPIFIDNPACYAEPLSGYRRSGPIPESPFRGNDPNVIVGSSYTQTPRSNRAIGRQIWQIGQRTRVVEIEINAAARDIRLTCAGVDDGETDSERIFNCVLGLDEPHEVDNERGTMRSKKLLSSEHQLIPREFSLVSNEYRLLSGGVSLRPCGDCEAESCQGNYDSSNRSPSFRAQTCQTAPNYSKVNDNDPAFVGAQFVGGLILFLLIGAAWYDWLNGAWERPPRSVIRAPQER
jgi:hypothetical protein